MKKFFTISAAVVVASSAISTAQTLSDAFESRSEAAPKFVTEAIRNGNVAMREITPVQMNKKAREMSMVERTDKSSAAAAQKPAATAAGENPFYVATEGTYYISTILAPGRLATYYNPSLYSQAYSATLKPIVGNVWTSTASSAADLSKYVAANGNLCLPYGIGGYYGPAISNGGDVRYYAGAYNPDKRDDYVVLYSATEVEPVPFEIYNASENSLYSGYTDTYGYGSITMPLDDAGTVIATSNVTRIDFGKPKGGSLLIDHIEFAGVSKTNQPLKDGATLDVQLITFDEEGNAKDIHTGLITADDIASISGTAYYVSASFFKDEDGFQAAYTPVIEDDFSLYISGFDNPNVDLGIFMVYDEGEANTTGSELGYEHNSWFLIDLQDGNGPRYRCWNSIDACVNLCGYYIGLCEYGTGAKTINGTVGVAGGPVISEVVDGSTLKTLDAYLVESTFDIDNMSIYDKPEWVSISVDTTGFSRNSWIFFLLDAAPLPEGTTGRQGDVVIGLSDVEASMTLHVVQGTDEYINTGIDNVKVSGAVCKAAVSGNDIVVSCPADVKSVDLYNAAGALVSTVAVEHGKAVFKNAPAGLNLVNFNGKQSVKVVK